MVMREAIEPAEWPWYDHKRYSFCMAARKGNYLFFSGNTASEFDPGKKTMVCNGDLLAQADVNYSKVKLLMEAAGGTMDDIVKVTDYVTPPGIEKYKQIESVKAKYFHDGDPAGTPMVVHHLLRPDAFLETECVAVLGMSKKRLIDPGWGTYAESGYTPAVLKGDLLCISGQVGKDYSNGKMAAANDIVAQAEQAYGNIETILKEAGGGFDDIIKTIEYISPEGLGQYNKVEQVRAKFFRGGFSTNTALGAYRNFPDDAMLKVDAIAVIGDSKREGFDLGLREKYEGLSYRPAVKKGKLICLSGVASTDLETGNLVDGDVVAQMKQALENSEKILAAAGVGWEDVLMVVDAIVPEAESAYRGTGKVRYKIFGKALPPSTGVIQNALIGPEGMLVNLDIVAAVD